MQRRNIPDEQLKFSRFYNRITTAVTQAVGRPIVTILAFLIVLGWAVTGPFFNYSDTWQLVINTGTTIITFLMVFIIQQSQNKDTAAIHLKLNELIASSDHASNRLIDIEDLTEEELRLLKSFYIKLSEKAEEGKELFASHSIDEAEDNAERKQKKHKPKAASSAADKRS